MKRHLCARAIRALCGATLLVAAATLATGCGQTIRAVTHVSTWTGGEAGDYIYLGYAENNTISKVELCKVASDNTMDCDEQDEVNKLLNPE